MTERKTYLSILLGILLLIGLYLTTLHSYLLFHALSELFGIVVACGIFMLAWNSRRFLDNSYLLFLGIAYLFIGGLDLIHTLAYTGMGVFPGYGTNLPTQLWVATRYLESLSLLIGVFFLGRKLRTTFVFLGYAFVFFLLLASVFYWDVFPVCFVEGSGLTLFKKFSEYAVCVVLLGSIVALGRKRRNFEPSVLRLLVTSIFLTMASELAFTFYVHAYGFSNLMGHYLKILSFYFIYKAIIETGLRKPYSLLFRDLKRSEEGLQDSEERFRTIVETAPSLLLVTDAKGNNAYVGPNCEEITGYTRQELLGQMIWWVHEDDTARAKQAFDRALRGGVGEKGFEYKAVKKNGELWCASSSWEPLRGEDGEFKGVVLQTIDVTEHKKAELEVSRAKDEWERTFDAVPDLIAILDNEHRILRMNKALADRLGCLPEEAVNRTCYSAIHGTEVPPDFCPHAKLLMDGKAHSADMHEERLRGDFIVSVSPLHRADGTLMGSVHVARDITERKRAEEALQKAYGELEQRVDQRTAELREANIRLTQEVEERRRAEEALRGKERVLAEAQRIAHVGNWDWNIVTNELHWSDEIYRIFGLRPQEFGATYEAFLECVHLDDREMVKDAVSKALGDSTAGYSIEHRVVRRDGSERVVHERGEVTFDEADSPIRMIGTVQDITERKEVEEKLRGAELRYRTVADFTYDWEYWENPDATIRYVSPSCQRITGYEAEEFIATPGLLEEIILPEDKGAWEAHRLAALESPRLREVQFRIRTRNGEIRWIEHNCQPVTDERGVFLGFRASNRDVTERRRAEEDARRLREELSHVTRVTMMGELAASLAHELNQPLAAILSNAQAARRFLLGEKPDLEEVGKALADIIQDDRRAGGVIRRVRSLLKKGDLGFIPLDMNGVIQEVVTLLKGEVAAKKVSLRLELASELPDVSGDRIQLQQVIVNLLLNGIEALSDPKCSSRELVVQTSRDDGGAIRIAVRDSGGGIDEENMGRIFNAFFTTKAGGLGMGLSIVRSIVEAHGGRLWATNNPGGGATFLFTLPVSHGGST